MESDSVYMVASQRRSMVVLTRAKVLRAGAVVIEDTPIEIGQSEPQKMADICWQGKIFVPFGCFLPRGTSCTLLICDTVLIDVIVQEVKVDSGKIVAHFQTPIRS